MGLAFVVRVLIASTALIVCAMARVTHVDAQDAHRLDGLAAVVGGTAPGPGVDAILRSDIELRARLHMAGRGAEPSSIDAIPSAVLEAMLAETIGEHLIAREARRVQAVAPPATEVARERSRLITAAGGEERMRAVLASLSASPAELDVIARRRALVGAFLSANLEGVAIVTDAEVERAYQAQVPSESQPAQTRAELRARMAREAFDGAVARWVTVLRARIPVRMYLSY